MMASDRLMDRAYGKAFQAVDVNQVMQVHSVQKVVHKVKWLPPDPNAFGLLYFCHQAER